MKIYESKKYYSRINKNETENTFLILNDNERTILQQLYVKLLKDIIHNPPVNFNHHDFEILQFIPKMFHYHSKRKECQMLDPSVYQLVKIDKMLNKIGIESFLEWLKPEMEGHVENEKEMKRIMDRKRQLKAKRETKNLAKALLAKEVLEF